MQDLTVDEAKMKLADLIAAALQGDEIVIRENGHAVKLVPVPEEAPRKRRQAGSMKGLIVYMADDFDAPLEDFKEYM